MKTIKNQSLKEMEQDIKRPIKAIDKLKHKLLCNPKIKMFVFNFPIGTGDIVSLSDILEEQVNQKYFLSEVATKKIIWKSGLKES